LRFLLIRHGETTWNATGRSQGQTDIPLSSKGEEQAQALCARLSEECIAEIASSDLSRASVTADWIASAHLDAARTHDVRLREMSLGEWEGLYTEEIVDRFADERIAWQREPETFRMPNGESFKELNRRVTIGIEEIVARHEPGATVVVVSHGYAILSFLVGMLEMPTANFRSLWLDPTGVCEVQVNDSQRILRRFNDTSHLVASLRAT
jgi:broad specificity phosphatase PhoE